MSVFLGKNYILANELTQKMGIHIANISMLKSQLSEYSDDIISMNNCTFIKTNSPKLPNNIRNAISTNTFEPMYNKLPCTFVHSEYELKESDLGQIIKGKIKICSKDFYEFTDEFVQKTKGKMIYVLSKNEAIQCLRKKQIQEYIELPKNRCLAIY